MCSDTRGPVYEKNLRQSRNDEKFLVAGVDQGSPPMGEVSSELRLPLPCCPQRYSISQEDALGSWGTGSLHS